MLGGYIYIKYHTPQLFLIIYTQERYLYVRINYSFLPPKEFELLWINPLGQESFAQAIEKLHPSQRGFPRALKIQIMQR